MRTLTWLFGVALAGALFTAAPGASADSKPHMQDGFHLGAGVGPGFLLDSFEQKIVFFGNKVEGTASGPSFGGQLTVGGALRPGLGLGGMLSFDQVANPKVAIEGVDTSSDDDIGMGTLLFFGPFIDWHVKAGEGFHLMGALGGARISVRDDTGNEREDVTPVGGGGMIGVGYAWWVGDEWSLGVLARAAQVGLLGQDVLHRVFTASVLVTGTYQ